MDITRLRELLADQDWRAADEETRRLLVAVADQGGFAGIDPVEVFNLDCALLLGIDDAWRTASDGRFGFGAQAAALAQVHRDGFSRAEAWRVFGTNLGWRRDEWVEETGLQYDREAPVGHLPWVFGAMPTVATGRTFEVLFLFYNAFNECAAAREEAG